MQLGKVGGEVFGVFCVSEFWQLPKFSTLGYTGNLKVLVWELEAGRGLRPSLASESSARRTPSGNGSGFGHPVTFGDHDRPVPWRRCGAEAVGTAPSLTHRYCNKDVIKYRLRWSAVQAQPFWFYR